MDNSVVVEIVVAFMTVLGNALVTWGVVQTNLKWLRRDVDEIREHIWGKK
jgi:hypothetical protein